jgi:Fe-S cluster biogenesis protein NfuA
MLGSCSGCPSETATLRNGILKAMTYYVGEVKNVMSVNTDTTVKTTD